MYKNCMKEIAELLGVKLNEKFKLKERRGYVWEDLFWIDEKGLINYNNKYYCDCIFVSLLSGEYEIVKL